MLSPAEQRDLNQAIDQSIARANRNLASLAAYKLTAAQQETALRVRTFLKQAQAARASDLEAARSLAERADLLSRDLVQGLH